MKTLICVLLLFSLALALPACNDGGGIFCYEHKDLDGRWLRTSSDYENLAGEIRFDRQGYIIDGRNGFEYLVGRRAQVDCGGHIHGEVDGQFESRKHMRLEGYDWRKI
jgi:hypothetical protein